MSFAHLGFTRHSLLPPPEVQSCRCQGFRVKGSGFRATFVPEAVEAGLNKHLNKQKLALEALAEGEYTPRNVC